MRTVVTTLSFLLLFCSANVNADVENEHELMYAAKNGLVKKIRTILATGVSEEAKNEALITAANFSKNMEAIILLLLGDADLNYTNKRGETALINAARAEGLNAYDTVKLLVGKGADPNKKDSYGRTALYYSLHEIDSGNKISAIKERIALFLMQNGANVNAKDSGNRTPLIELTDSYIRKDVFRLQITYETENLVNRLAASLVKAGADVNAQTKYGITALMYAARKRNGDLVTFLLSKGARADLKDRRGRTAAEFAVQRSGGPIYRKLKKQEKIDSGR